MSRAHFLLTTQWFALNQACRAVVDGFGPCVYHVGSSLARADYRDVDVRCILDDADYQRMFPGGQGAAWALLCAALSEWLSARTGLPVDFQFQEQTVANAEFQGRRSALGIARRDECAWEG